MISSSFGLNNNIFNVHQFAQYLLNVIIIVVEDIPGREIFGIFNHRTKDFPDAGT